MTAWLWRGAGALAGVAYVVLLGWALLPLSRADVWVSPDEAATAAFARAYAATGTFTLSEPLNAEVGGILGARSMVARGEVLVPGGFLGMPWIAGGAAKVLGDGVLGWIAPLFAGVAVLAWGDMWRRLAGWRVGVGSAVLVAVHPAWLLYASRPLMPNVPFVACLMLAAWALVRWPRRWWGGALSGGLLMLALTIRTAEAVWVIPGALALLWIYRRNIAREAWVSGFAAALLVAGAFAGLQAATYGHALTSGYTYHESSAGQAALTLPGAVGSSWPNWLQVLFPFGIHERSVVRHAWHYGWHLQWWWSLVPTIGAGWVLWSWWKKKELLWQRVLLGMLVAVGGWLAVVYGSWTFFDNPDPRLITLGNSYARYFLPAFVLASPLGAWVLEEFARKRHQAYVAVTLIAVTLASLVFVVRGPDGWQHVQGILPSAQEKRAVIMQRTPPEAIIIMDRSDKYLVGYRQHLLVPLRDQQTYAALGKLAKHGPLYYFGLTLPSQDIEHLQQTVLAPQGLTITSLQTIGDETLYQVQ